MFLLLVVIFVSVEKVLSSDSEVLSQRCLKAHNEYRTRHGAPPLKWSGELAEEAQSWANHLAAIDQMERDPNTKEGENIFYMYGGNPSEACDRAVENWYSEVRNYDFKSPQKNQNTEHFSQVVWKNTKEIGVGTAESKSGNFFLVARYSPKGNTDGAFLDNVDNALDVLVTLNPEGSEAAVHDQPKQAPTPSDVPQKLDDNASSEPIITISSTASPGPSVPMTTVNSSDLSTFQNQPSSQTPFKNEDKKEGTAKELGAAGIVGNEGNDSSKLGSRDNANPGSPPMADITAGMKVKPPKSGKDFRVELRFPNMKYTEKMAYPSSKEFENVRIEITAAILQLYEEDDDFQEVQLLELRNGSVIANLGLIFAKEGENHLDRLTLAVAMGKLGDLELSRDYVFAGALPDGYLKLTRPHQPSLIAQCPQPCSNPTHCFPTGCHVTCCSFHPTPVTPVANTYLKPLQPPLCPGSCDSSCLPQCTSECCNYNKEPSLQQEASLPNLTQQQASQPEVIKPEAIKPEVIKPEVSQPEESKLDVSQTEVSHSNQGYSCPATCPFACYPQCTPECCGTSPISVTPVCLNDCAHFCSVSCPQECCGATKSSVHSMKHSARFPGSKPSVSPVVSPITSKIAYTDGSKNEPVRHAIYGKRVNPDYAVKYNFKNLQAYLKKISSYKKPASKNVKAIQSLAFRPKGGSLKNAVRYKQKPLHPRQVMQGKFMFKSMSSQGPHAATKAFINSRFNFKPSSSFQTSPGVQAIKDMKSKGAPLDIRFAYRYGNRLLVPIDMPNMDIKQLNGKKFISVPAFKRSMIEGRIHEHDKK